MNLEGDWKTWVEPLREHGPFGTIYVDPPWQYDNKATRSSADGEYSTMSLGELLGMGEFIRGVSGSPSHLYLWTTNGFLLQCGAIFDAWGFNYKSCFVWAKSKLGIGNYWRVCHEFLLLGVSGRLRFKSRSLRSWAVLPRGRHSAKPDAVRKMIEENSPEPRLELFARKASSGWTCCGSKIEHDLFV